MFFSILENGLIVDETKKCAGISTADCFMIVEEFFENAKIFFKYTNTEIVPITYEILEGLLKEIPVV